jgi:hypothetical protein
MDTNTILGNVMEFQENKLNKLGQFPPPAMLIKLIHLCNKYNLLPANHFGKAIHVYHVYRSALALETLVFTPTYEL